MPASLAACVPRVHCQSDVCLRQRGSIVGAVTNHRDQLAVGLFLADVCQLRFRGALRDEVVDAGVLRNRRSGQRVVSCNHHAADAHRTQTLQAFADTGLEHVGEHDDADNVCAFGNHQWRRSLRTDGIHDRLKVRRNRAGLTLDEFDDRIGSTLANLSAVRKINSTHTCLRGKSDKARAVRRGDVGRSSAAIEMEFDDGFSFRRFVRDRRQRRQPSNLLRRGFADRQEIRRVPIAHRDSAGLVEQNGIDVAGGLHRLATLGHDVRLQRAIHPGDTYSGEQRANRCRNQTHEQRDQRRDIGAEAPERFVEVQIALHVNLCIQSHRPERNHDDQKREA